MKLVKMLGLLSVALFPLAPASVETMPSVLNNPAAMACEDSASCGRCGDRYCAKQCGETATSCPIDCGTAY